MSLRPGHSRYIHRNFSYSLLRFVPPRFSDVRRITPGSPFLHGVSMNERRMVPGVFPFTLPLFDLTFEVNFPTPVTILVGENGSGKSTLLEALAWLVGFGSQGGSRDHQFVAEPEPNALGRALEPDWQQRVHSGFFLRAETFFNFASHLENVESLFTRYGGKSLHLMSHGEAFLALFENRFEDGLYILDEPEAALSPQRQLALLSIIHRLSAPRNAQFIIATHSPILMAFPGATILSLDGETIREVDYRDTDHFKITRDFLADPARYFHYLFADDADE